MLQDQVEDTAHSLSHVATLFIFLFFKNCNCTSPIWGKRKKKNKRKKKEVFLNVKKCSDTCDKYLHTTTHFLWLALSFVSSCRKSLMIENSIFWNQLDVTLLYFILPGHWHQNWLDSYRHLTSERREMSVLPNSMYPGIFLGAGASWHQAACADDQKLRVSKAGWLQAGCLLGMPPGACRLPKPLQELLGHWQSAQAKSRQKML